MSSFQDLLLSIAQTADGFIEVLDARERVSAALPSSHYRDESLLPPVSGFVQRLQHQLKTIPLDESLRQSAVDIFTTEGQSTRLRILNGTAKALGHFASLGGSPEEQSLYIQAVRSQYSRRMLDCIDLMLKPLRDGIAAYQADVDSAASAESSSESEDGGEGGARGHRAEAVAILERAYAYAQNITQAEKRKLAELTGLEPRQVVIW